MRKVLSVLSLFLLLVIPVLAGGYVEVDAPKILPPDSPMPSAPIYVDRIVEKLPPRPVAANGSAIGLHGYYPSWSYAIDDYDFEAGYSSRIGDQSLLLRAAKVISRKEWTLLKIGAALYPGNGPLWGIYGELEQFLEQNISISAAIYPVKSGNGQTIWGDGVIGARLYF